MNELNKYQRWYNELIERARNRVIEGYVEKHHIIPKSLGGTDDKSNLVKLTAREHLIAHMLLPRFIKGKPSLWYALWGMMNKNDTRFNSRLYEQARFEHARMITITRKGKPSPKMRGRPWTPARRAAYEARGGRPIPKISAALKGRKHTEEFKARLSAIRKAYWIKKKSLAQT